MLSGIVTAVFLSIIVIFLVMLISIGKEVKRKVKIDDYVKNAIDGVEKDFTSNFNYNLIYTKGIKAVKKNDKVKLYSQSKLTGISILK